jgi:hypothetical protein
MRRGHRAAAAPQREPVGAHCVECQASAATAPADIRRHGGRLHAEAACRDPEEVKGTPTPKKVKRF